MSGSRITPLLTCSRQNVNMGLHTTVRHLPPPDRTSETPLHCPSSWLSAVTTPWWGGLFPDEVLGIVVVQGAEKKGAATTRTVWAADTSLLCSRTCYNNSFLSLTFHLIMCSYWRVFKVSWLGSSTGALGGSVVLGSLVQWGGWAHLLWMLCFFGACGLCFGSPAPPSLHIGQP